MEQYLELVGDYECARDHLRVLKNHIYWCLVESPGGKQLCSNENEADAKANMFQVAQYLSSIHKHNKAAFAKLNDSSDILSIKKYIYSGLDKLLITHCGPELAEVKTIRTLTGMYTPRVFLLNHNKHIKLPMKFKSFDEFKCTALRYSGGSLIMQYDIKTDNMFEFPRYEFPTFYKQGGIPIGFNEIYELNCSAREDISTMAVRGALSYLEKQLSVINAKFINFMQLDNCPDYDDLSIIGTSDATGNNINANNATDAVTCAEQREFNSAIDIVEMLTGTINIDRDTRVAAAERLLNLVFKLKK